MYKNLTIKATLKIKILENADNKYRIKEFHLEDVVIIEDKKK